MNKEELVKKMNDELFNSEIVDKGFFILSMIKQNIEERNEDDEIIKALSQYEKPLHTAYEIFTSYINMEQVLDKVFKDFFIKGQSHRGIIKIVCIVMNSMMTSSVMMKKLMKKTKVLFTTMKIVN